MKEKDIILKWLNNMPLTEEESKVFENLDAFDSYVKISETAKNFKAPLYDVEENLEELKPRLSKTQHTKASHRYIGFIARIAALFILGIGSYFAFFYASPTEYNTLASQKITFELPDKSVVNLNALSTIEYQEKNWEDQRKIKLNGEAYFKVAKGKKFDIETSAGIVSVLGTEFNVKQRNNYFEVSCYEGLVGVTYKDQNVKLSAGKVFRVIQGNILNTHTGLSKPDWTQNRSSFVSTPYTYVLKEFERQYNVQISIKNIDQRTLFTGNFVHSNIQTALQSITIPMRLKYEINDNDITLYKE